MDRFPAHTRRPVLWGAVAVALATLPFLGLPTPAAWEPTYAEPTYRVVTGLALAALVVLQWSYVILRRRPGADAKGLLVQHLWLGVAAPALLLLHALSAGYGYQTALVWVFLANCAVGLLSPRVATRTSSGISRLWLPLHIAGSVSVLALIVIHVIVVTRYH